MTILNKLMFLWNQRNEKEIPIDDPNYLIFNNGTYECRISPNDNTEMMIYRYSTDDTDLKNEKDALQLVQSISKKYPKINTFTIENPKNINNPFKFYKDKNGNIISSIIDKKELNIKEIEKQSKNKQEKNINHTSELNDQIEEDKNIDFDKIRKREVDDYTEGNLSNFISDNEIKLTLNGEPIKIKTINPLLSEDQVSLFISDKLDSINYEYNKENDDSEFGEYSYKPSMGFMLMLQNVISSEEPQTADNMYLTLRRKLSKIAREMTDKKAKKLDKQLQGSFGFDYYKKMPLIYKKFIEQWVAGEGNIPVKGSGEFYSAMTSYFPEFISPFVPLYSSKNEDCITNMEPINLLKSKILGSSKNPDAILRKQAFISYPLGKSNPLYDSVLMFKSGKKYQCILLSTKGGMTGKGAMASAGGLKSFIYNSDAAIPQIIFTDCKNKHFDASLYTNAYLPYMVNFANESPYNKFALKVLSAFILSSSDYYQEIVDSIYNVIFVEKKRISRNTSKYEKAKKVETFLNSDESIQKCVLAALTYGSYGFAQINSKQKPNNGEDFTYTYSIQYPAIFTGHIDFSFIKGQDENNNPKYKKLQFHIMGNDKI